ncbi:MAG: glycosyl transferase [Bacteroidetes bacterium]|nr:MAG: glycosyl transferase [Bacteroidota bacterium]
MKVLIVNQSDNEGGAARAAYRLHRALLESGVDSQMCVQSRILDDFTVLGPHTKMQKVLGKFRPIIDSLPVRHYKDRTKTLFSPAWLPFSPIVHRINTINPDVVHLHWIAGGMMRIEDIAKIKAPVVWSLHDDWGFTGGCHIKWECKRYQQACGQCPRLGSLKENDLSRRIFLRKQKTFAKIQNLTVIGLSRWLADCAKESALFKKYPISNLPNLLNTESFAPFDKHQARSLLNLPQNKKMILFGALSATSDINKGFKELTESLLHIDSENTELVVFGSNQPKTPQGFKQKAHYLGRLYDDVSLRILYAAADVMVVPSLQENLSNAIMESMACGTPVVGFDIGGNSDMIEHRTNGYLAKPFDTTDLACGIEWVLNNASYEELCQNARKKVVAEFDSKFVALKYMELYSSLSVNLAPKAITK